MWFVLLSFTFRRSERCASSRPAWGEQQYPLVPRQCKIWYPNARYPFWYPPKRRFPSDWFPLRFPAKSMVRTTVRGIGSHKDDYSKSLIWERVCSDITTVNKSAQLPRRWLHASRHHLALRYMSQASHNARRYTTHLYRRPIVSCPAAARNW